MARNIAGWVAAGVAGVAACGVWLVAGGREANSPRANHAHDTQASNPAPTNDEGSHGERSTPNIAANRAAKPQGAAEKRARERQERRRVADELRKKLAALGYGSSPAAAEPKSTPPAAARMPRPVRSGNQAGNAMGQYIRAVVREQFHPVAGSCYEQLLERKPEAEGDVVLEISIVGNDDLGGVVEHVEVREQGTTLTDEDFLLCVRESMYTTTFDAPPDGKHSFDMIYPFSFAP